ncbi:MAG: hypothetical protein ACXWNW_15335 [Isosphaeraceae bacterium]
MFVALFLHWYKAEAGGTTASINGFSAFEFVDVMLTLLAAGVIAIVVADLTEGRRSVVSDLREEGGSVTAGLGWRAVHLEQWGLLILGALALIVVVFQLLNTPPFLDFFGSAPGSRLTVHREIGAWLALAGAIAITIAGLINSRSEERSQ